MKRREGEKKKKKKKKRVCMAAHLNRMDPFAPPLLVACGATSCHVRMTWKVLDMTGVQAGIKREGVVTLSYVAKSHRASLSRSGARALFACHKKAKRRKGEKAKRRKGENQRNGRKRKSGGADMLMLSSSLNVVYPIKFDLTAMASLSLPWSRAAKPGEREREACGNSE